MKFETKEWLLLQKKYFDIGYGQTSQLKYLLIAMGAAWQNVKGITIISIIYAICCYIFGWLYIRYEWMEADNEVSNKLNRFQREVREHINTNNFK